MATTTYEFTGIKPFWSYDSFSISKRYIGGGTGFINTAGGVVDVTDTAEEEDIQITTAMNLVFMVNDLVLKFHKMSPFVTRFYNSTEGDNSKNLNSHYGLMGKFWIFNYEHCLIEDDDEDEVWEIDPSGARNFYDNPSSGVYTSSDGVLKKLTKASGEFDLEDRNRVTWHFKALGSSDPNTSSNRLYRLEYIKDINNVRVYVEWEEKDADPSGSTDNKWRISKVSVSTDSGTTKTTFIKFEYMALDISGSHYHFIKTMTDYDGNVWTYNYDTSGQLTRVIYPVDELDHNYSYSENTELETITDMNSNDWKIDYSLRTRKISVDGSYEIVTYTWVGIPAAPNGTIRCDKTDEESKVWRYDHTCALTSPPGNLTDFYTPTNLGSAYPYKYTWTKNQMTKMETPLATKNSTGAYYEYVYLPGGVAGDPVGGSPPAQTNNGQGNLVVSRFYDGSSFLNRYRTDFNYNSDNELEWVGKDLQSGNYPTAVYFTKTEYTYDTDGNLVKTLSGINEAATPAEEPEDASLDVMQQFEYDSYGNITKSVSGNGNESTMTYDDYGAVTERKDPGGFKVNPVWDDRHLYLTAMKDELGFTRNRKTDVLGLLLERQDPLGNIRKYIYDDNGNPVKYVEPMGNTHTTIYNEKNNPTQLVSPSGIVQLYQYDKTGNSTKIRKYHDGSSFDTDFTYDDSSRMTKIAYTIGTNTYETDFQLDEDSHITKVSDPDNNDTTYTFDNYGNTTEVIYPYTDALEGATTYHYRLKVNNYYTGPMGAQDRTLRTFQKDTNSAFPSPSTVDTQGEMYDYDRLGRMVIREASPDWDFVSTGTLSNEDVKYLDTQFFDADGNSIANERSTWEWNNSETRWEFQSSKANQFEYDNRGNKIKDKISRTGTVSDTEADAYVTTYDFDARRQLIKTETGSMLTKIYSYDAAGRMTSTGTINSSGSVISSGTSDMSARITETAAVNTAMAIMTTFEYDKNGSNIAIIDGNGIKKEFQYDNENRIVTYIDGMKRVTERNYYQDSGFLKQIVRPNGDYVEYEYDISGRITKVYEMPNKLGTTVSAESSNETLKVIYTLGTYTFDGTPFTDANETVQYQETGEIQAFSTDKNGRIRYYHFYDNSNNGTFYKYIYDAFGNLKKVIKPDTNEIEYEYDKMNRMTKEILDPENGTPQEFNEFTYNCCSMNDFTQTEGGTALPSHPFEYDHANRMTKETYKWVDNAGTQHITNHEFEYAYDNAGRRIRMVDPYWSTLVDGSQNPIPRYTHYNFDSEGRKQSTDRTRELSESMTGGETRNRPWAGETFLKPGSGETNQAEHDPGGRPVRVTYSGTFGEAVLEVLYTYFDDNQIKDIVARDITDDTPVEIYAIEYKYDKKGRRVRQTVWNTREDTWPQYDAIYEYDYRDRLVEERYLKYNTSTERMDVYRAREYTYDIYGNMTKKKILEGDDWIEYTITYSNGAHITNWNNTVSSGSVNSNLVPTYDANGNMTQLPALTVTSGPNQFDLLRMDFTYDRKNRLSTYQINQGDTRTLKWDALGRIREKTWTEDSTTHKQVFYHDGRTLMQIWDETKEGVVVSRDIAYDLYVGETGYLKDIDFNSEPDEEGYLVKDAQGSVRAIVNVTYSGGTYTVTTERYNTDGYGAWLDFDAAHSNGTHYMRYISTRVEDYCNSGSTNDNQALYHTDNRHYLPFLGIFLQREPLMIRPNESYISGLSDNPAGLNPYRYSLNRPTSIQDSSGLAVCQQTELQLRCDKEFRTRRSECTRTAEDNLIDLKECANVLYDHIDTLIRQSMIDCALAALDFYIKCVAKGLGILECTTGAKEIFRHCMFQNLLPIYALQDKVNAFLYCWTEWVVVDEKNCICSALEDWCKCCVETHCCCYHDADFGCYCQNECPADYTWGFSGPDHKRLYSMQEPNVPATSCPCCYASIDQIPYPDCSKITEYINANIPNNCKLPAKESSLSKASNSEIPDYYKGLIRCDMIKS